MNIYGAEVCKSIKKLQLTSVVSLFFYPFFFFWKPLATDYYLWFKQVKNMETGK